ncbi:hypothetical protein [Segatella buccae]|uniref:hypothetical protein n=1 Tax=Segatella buccae TaxID=28126 RepID=UPI0027B9F33F|nr:hypothetical protein [Segatella buccae]
MGWMKELGKAAAKVAEKPLAKVGVKFAEKSAESAEKSVGRALANAAMKEGRYASKANYTKWIESMGGKATKVESGFKSWEKSLPQFKTGFKSTEHIGAKTAQKTERIMVDGTKATGQGVVHSTKAAEKVAEETAKKAALINKETLKNAAKVGWREGGKVINKTAGWAGQYAKYSANHPVASLILSSVAYRQLTGRTLLPDMMKSLGGEDAAKKGLVGVLGETTLGKKVDGQGNEVGMVANLTDVLFGDGTYEKVSSGVGSVAGEAAGVYQGVKGGVSSVLGEGAHLYETGKEQIGQYFSGNGMVSNGNGGYYDPTTPQYPSTSQIMGSGMTQGVPQQGGLTGTMVNGVHSIANELTGGNVSKMNLASLALSSYMMFGPFGWLGKMASLMLGGMTMRNINQRQSESLSMQQMQRYAVAPAVSAGQSVSQVDFSVSEEPVVRRSRGI